VAGDQLAVPAQQRRWGNEERGPTLAGEQPGQGGQHDPVGGLQLGAVDLATQDRDLVTQHKEFDIFGAAITSKLSQHPQYLAQQQVHQ
jgi:hypothetical protein